MNVEEFFVFAVVLVVGSAAMLAGIGYFLMRICVIRTTHNGGKS